MLGAVALAAGLVWWSLTIPYRPGAVYESLPSNVVLNSVCEPDRTRYFWFE